MKRWRVILAVGVVLIALPLRAQVVTQSFPMSVSGMVLIARSLETLNTPTTLSNLLSSVPDGSRVAFWPTPTSQLLATKARGAWSAPLTNVISLAGSFWFKAPGTAFTLAITGTVPTQSVVTLQMPAGTNAVGHPYGASVPWSNIGAPNEVPMGSSLALFDVSNQTLRSFRKTRGGWPGVSNVVLAPGQGFLLIHTNDFEWTVEHP